MSGADRKTGQQAGQRYAYVVVGGGSSGCIAAARLAEHGEPVLLLEAGEHALAHPDTLTADGFKHAFANDATMWHRMSTAQQAVAGRRLYAGSGRGLGGSGAVNGMVYTRGDRHDFAAWPKGWQWSDVAPHFAAMEKQLGIQTRPPTAFAQRFIDAGCHAGLRRKDGMNDGDLSAVIGCNAMNFSGQDRRSSYRAWLHDGAPQNLSILCQAQVQRIEFDDERRAVAVLYGYQGKQCRSSIDRELILCAGALETPRLLMLSGVGPAQHLSEQGITPVLDAPGVGENLQDHPNVCLFYRAKQAVDFQYPQVYAFDAAERPLDQPSADAPDTCFVCYAAPASIKQSTQRMLPILLLPAVLYRIKALRGLLRGLIELAFLLPPLQRFVSRVFGIVVILGKPQSRGRIRLRSADPADPAEIDLACLADPRDQALLEAGIKKARDIVAQIPFQEAGSRPLSAGAKEVSGKRLWRWINKAVMTTFHYCGSCRMGEDAASPVDTQLRVKGLRNVRIADASVIPEISVSALNAPSMLIGYRLADLIRAEAQTTHEAKASDDCLLSRPEYV